MAQKHKNTSFLRNASTLSNGQFLGTNNLPKIRPSLSDELYEIGHRYDERPDLLAHDLYGDSNLWWVFSLRNPDLLKDPIRDFKSGLGIIIPSVEQVKSL